ncbi:hypothetical protein F5148DRAFT_1264100 [Russula earlei]|uniref:Uncharacterized protein n=1 Tax=Russula earlei TaxID=71964 RepID=A0ACC0TRR9_9AGAM|nr:hypothetical protein F5148DRAFT_1264100 [Russula earlei]
MLLLTNVCTWSQRTLSQKNILHIVDLRLKEVQDRLSERKMILQVDNEVKSYFAARGYSPAYHCNPSCHHPHCLSITSLVSPVATVAASVFPQHRQPLKY